MKKILFLLLLSVTMYGQVPADATPLENIQITNNIQDNISDRVSVSTSDGVLNWKYAKDLIIPAKAFLSTGLIKNGLISANGDPTKFNITAGIGIISNFDDPENPVSTIINFPAFNSITPAYLTTGNITYVAINSTPAVVMQATPFTPEQRRSLIVLGATIHSNLTTINVLNNISAPTNADTNQLHDFMEAVGALNITGNKYTANGANLQLNKSAGVLFKLGSNFAVDWKNPHEIAQTGGTAITFRYRTQNGTESADMTSISPGLYDLNNVLTTVPNNKFTIQTVTVFQTGLTRIQWGQTIYDDLQSAKNALLTRDFVVENNIKENGVTRAYIIVRNSTTSLQNVSDAYISEAQKFGGVASGGVALTLANIVTALGYTPENIANKSDSFTVSSSTTYSSTKALVDGLATKQNTLTNPITGTGTTNTIPKWTGTTTQGNSRIFDNGTNIGIGTVTPTTNAAVTIEGSFPVSLILKDNSGTGSGFTAQNNTAIAINERLGYVVFAGLDSALNPVNSSGISSVAVSEWTPTSRPANLRFETTNVSGSRMVRGEFSHDGNFLVNTTVNNGQGVIQANGNITASPATLSNQVVTFGQVFTSPTFTGVPSVPTATAGTNTTQIASTAFVTSQNAVAPINEGNGIGYAINGRVAANYGNIGLNAIDLGFSSSASSTIGATGSEDSVLGGRNNTANGGRSIIGGGEGNVAGGFGSSITGGRFNQALGTNSNIGGGQSGYIPSGTASATISGGEGNQATASYSLITGGINNVASGVSSSVIGGEQSISSSYGEISGGTFNNYQTAISATSWSALDRILSIGNGTSSIDKSDALVILKNGLTTLPSVTVSLIQAESSGKAVITKEYANRVYTVSTLPTPVSGVAYATVSDALAPTYMTTIVGGGTVKAPVFYDGTVWRSTINSDSVSLTGNQTIGGIKTFTGPLIVSNLGGGPSRIVSADVDGKLSASSVFTHDGQIAVTNSVTANSFIKTGGTASQFLKADGSVDESDVVKNIAKDATQGANVTGTVSETILYSKLIPANTFKDGDFMTLFSRVARPSPTASSGGVNQRVRINTSNTLTGATQIAINTLTAGVNGNQVGNLSRIITLYNGFMNIFPSSTSLANDYGNFNANFVNITFDPTVDNYIFITGQLGFSGDTMYHVGTKITN